MEVITKEQEIWQHKNAAFFFILRLSSCNMGMSFCLSISHFFFTFLSLLKFLRFSIRLCLSISFIRDAPVVPVCVRALPSQSTPRRLPPWCKLRARSVSRSRCRNWQCRLGTTDHLSRKPEGPRRHPVLNEKIWKVWNNPLLKSTSKALKHFCVVTSTI